MKLRVASYNIHRAIGVDRRFRPQRIVDVLAEHEPDLVLLQEVDEGVPRSRELDLARELAEALGFEHYAVGHNVSLRKGRYGNATLSRFPILRERNLDLTIGNKKRRGCQHTTLALDGDRAPRLMEVFNLHLGLSARERRQQAGLLASSPELSRVDASVPCLVGGDFNDWRSRLRPFFTDMLRFRCATDRQTQKGPHAIKTYPSFAPRGGLDRIYHRGPIKTLRAYACRHKLAQSASDHLPVIVDFGLL